VDAIHWFVFVGGVMLGMAAGEVLGRSRAKSLYAKASERLTALDERLSLIEAWIRQLSTLQKMTLHREKDVDHYGSRGGTV
jgi:hypothetical protein